VLYAGFNSIQNSNNCNIGNFPTSIIGVPLPNQSILTAPPVTLNNPNGYNFGIICSGYSCDVNTYQGGCNTIDQIEDYFMTQLGGTLYSLNAQYCCWLSSDIYQVSQLAGSCCNSSTSTITLTSAINTDNQIVCSNSPITTITYSYSNATPIVSGLPNGVNASVINGIVTINGTPTIAGTFNYNLSVPANCGTVQATVGSITVNNCNISLTLTSPPTTISQTVCINTAINNITYNVVGATGATVSGLPSGVTGVYNSGVFTITGTSTQSGTFNYTITTTGGSGIPATANGTITVNNEVTPTFNYTTITTCIPDFLPTVMLNTTSNNNIVGTWFPDQILIVPGTTTYTFTPNAGQCATTFSFQWTMNPLVTPTFNSIPALCFGSTAPILATTSLNGISGTWSPSTIDTNVSGTTIHTFTPDVGECANPITLSITVAPQLTPVISIVQLCSSNSVSVTSPIGNNFQYAVDGGPFQISPLFLNIAPGNHSIVVNQINANCFSNPINFIPNSL
jgi:hypothetical protein